MNAHQGSSCTSSTMSCSPVGQLDERSMRMRSTAISATERRNHPRRLDRVLAPVGLVALVERPVAGEQVVERSCAAL